VLARAVPLALATVLALAGCGEDDTEFLLDGSRELALDATNVGALVGRPFLFADGRGVSPAFAGVPTTLTFVSTSTLSASGGGGTLEATVSFAPCVATFPGAPPETWDPCLVRVGRAATAEPVASVSLRLGVGLSDPLEIPASVTPEAGGRTCTLRLEGSLLASGVPCTEAGGSGDLGVVGPRG
jgi:hypothetical protein